MPEIPYFKIKYALRSSWSIKDASYLLLGYDPIKDKLSPLVKEHPILSLRVFLRNSDLGVPAVRQFPTIGKKIKRRARYNTDAFFRVMRASRKKYDKLLYQTCKQAQGDPSKEGIDSKISKAVYLEAHRLLQKAYPNMNLTHAAEALEDLSEELLKAHGIVINKLQTEQIRKFLKSSPAGRGRPPKGAGKPKIKWGPILKQL